MGIKAKQKENTEGVKTEENVELTATLSVFIQKCRSKRFTHYRINEIKRYHTSFIAVNTVRNGNYSARKFTSES